MAEGLRVPQVGEAAPPINAEVTGGGTFELAAQCERWVVVYFFPRANTPG